MDAAVSRTPESIFSSISLEKSNETKSEGTIKALEANFVENKSINSDRCSTQQESAFSLHSRSIGAVPQLNDKSQRILQLEASLLEHFPVPVFNPVDYDRRAGSIGCPDHYFISNEYPEEGTEKDGISHPYAKSPVDYQRTLLALRDKVPLDTNNLRVALLIGESSILTCLPELDKICDLIIILDNDPFLLNVVMERIEQIKTADIMDELYLNLSICDRFISNQHIQERFLLKCTKQKKSTGDFHPFSSPSRLSAVKKSLSDLPIIPVYANLFSQKMMKEFTDILSQHQSDLEFFNLTNVLDYNTHFYAPGLKNNYLGRGSDYLFLDKSECYKHLKRLPIHPTTLCAYSTFLSLFRSASGYAYGNDIWEHIKDIPSSF
ncbi:MAG: hypothetical protein ACR2PX_22705 [Endozoicomonas sp.]|uniref:hypothetical protein n=1 Tax=Endozoicomonas sp. TaxID=1892382 RepID=UPI003D9B58D5